MKKLLYLILFLAFAFNLFAPNTKFYEISMAMQKAAKITHIPFNKLAARFFMESSWRMVDVQEKDGALSCGISQCGLYAGKRVDPKCTIAKLHNMEYNIIAGAKYYRLLLKKYHGCYAMAISVYTGHKHIAQKLFLAEKKLWSKVNYHVLKQRGFKG